MLPRVSKLLYSKGCHIGVWVRTNTGYIVILHRHALITTRSRDSCAVGKAALVSTLKVRILGTNRICFQVILCVTIVVLIHRPRFRIRRFA